MKSEPFISVIIPNYNHSKYLKQRIDSVLNQTYKSFEVIILDDCSTDDSKGVILSYKNNPHVSHIIFNDKNSGSTFIQWDKGFKLAKGDYIWIAESDDFCDLNMLELLVAQVDLNPSISIAFVSSHLVDAEGSFIRKEKDHGISVYSSSSFISKRLAFGNAIVNASSAIFSRPALLKIKSDYKSFKAVGDYLFWIYLSEQGNVVWIKDAHNYFRQHKNKVTPNAVKSGLTFVEDSKIFDYLKKSGYLSGMRENLSHGYFIWLLFMTQNLMDRNTRTSIRKIWNKKFRFPILNMCLFLIYDVFINYRRLFVRRFKWQA